MWCNEAIFSWNFERHNFLWVGKPFLFEENSIYDDDMTAKIEFLQLHKDACLTADLTREDVGKLWADTSIKNE